MTVRLSAFTAHLCQHWSAMMADVAVMLPWGLRNNQLVQPYLVNSDTFDTAMSCCGITLGVIGIRSMYYTQLTVGLVHNSVNCPSCEDRDAPEVCIWHNRTVPQTIDALLVACLGRSRSCLTGSILNVVVRCKKAWVPGQQL